MRLGATKLTAAILVLILAGVAWRISSQMIDEREQKRLEIDEIVQIEQAVLAMTTAKNAVSDWKKELGDPTNPKPIYTAGLESLFVRDDGRPLLIYGSLDDVKEQNGVYLLVLKSDLNLHGTVRLVLECDSNKAKDILGRRVSDFENNYAVVAQIRSVHRLDDEVLSGQNDETQDTVSEASPVFVADGRALDLLFVGTYGFIQDLAKPRAQSESK